ncbi:DUF6223 family protein [Amycolatopsis magusensis]|uniref:Peptidoglycan/LPS O-acetylase OafA/YrhL n=1 Tax=Amycolatopsis magusensis TaxID=882444 RepID=A0ABS4PVV8_9PSEU|nr:DUF6223 family protein [Amycolatopsis magusensis]MBP2183561.1 peptidoglycan/LPS O-acetylase OafA/YrhL [Amycolatopsis magusensis]MDI5975029.1 DUF6223 family protein [Amycolatopsis magusensis]
MFIQSAVLFGLTEPAVDAYTLTAGRFWATSAALLGLAGTILGGLALARAARKTAWVASASGLVALTGGVLNLATADGGPGTGNGVVGGVAAVGLGLLALVLGGRALTR